MSVQKGTSISLLPFVSKIITSDKKLVQETLQRTRPDSKNYEDSWGYIIQATRYGGFKWFDKRTGSLIFFGRKSNSDQTLVVPSYFAENEYLASAVNAVQAALKAPKTILKNAPEESISELCRFGFREYNENEQWSKEARFDDQTYPQLIIDLQKLIEKDGRSYHLLRKALNKNPNISIRKYNGADRETVLKIFDLKDGDTKDTIGKRKGVYYTSHVMYPDADITKFVVVDNQNGEIIGFTATSDITSEITTLIASLFKPGIKVASIWAMYQTLAIKYQQGFQFANLGGCETEMIYTFKCEKFPPVKKLFKKHLIFVGQIK